MKKLLTLAGMLLLTWLIIQYPRLMINPGELAEDHQEIRDKCNDCHDPFWGISSNKCIKCHALEEIGIDDADTTIAFHAKLTDVECTSCHTEHKGLHPDIITSRFNHDMLTVDMRSDCKGCHLSPSDTLHQMVSDRCSMCHTTSGWQNIENFDHTMILTESALNCGSCHRSPSDSYHQSLTGDCSECHSTSYWTPSTFDHSSYFVFDNHHNVQCNTCHTNNIYSGYTCYGCHEHSESNIRKEHEEEGILEFNDCASCHHSADEDDAKERYRNNEKGKNKGIELQQFIDKQNGHDREDDD